MGNGSAKLIYKDLKEFISFETDYTVEEKPPFLFSQQKNRLLSLLELIPAQPKDPDPVVVPCEETTPAPPAEVNQSNAKEKKKEKKSSSKSDSLKAKDGGSQENVPAQFSSPSAPKIPLTVSKGAFESYLNSVLNVGVDIDLDAAAKRIERVVHNTHYRFRNNIEKLILSKKDHSIILALVLYILRQVCVFAKYDEDCPSIVRKEAFKVVVDSFNEFKFLRVLKHRLETDSHLDIAAGPLLYLHLWRFIAFCCSEPELYGVFKKDTEFLKMLNENGKTIKGYEEMVKLLDKDNLNTVEIRRVVDIVGQTFDLFVNITQELGCSEKVDQDKEETKLNGNEHEESKMEKKEEEKDSEYVNEMKNLQFDSADLTKLAFHYREALEQNPTKEKLNRLVHEVTSLSTSLPLGEDGGVFFRVDENRLDIMKALIIGPKGTPYSGGCFEFDIYPRKEYPHRPPKFHLLTTGNNTFRFNPNLYQSGKVCLSLLGTWMGSRTEQWNNTSSTLLQVFLSIQALILVDEPYFNEPGYELKRQTAKGISSSQKYNNMIRYGTVLYAMLGQLKNTQSIFYEVMQKHFKLRKAAILEQVERWAREGALTAVPSSARIKVDWRKILLDLQYAVSEL